MRDLNKKLMIEQLDRKFEKLAVLKDLEISPKGWINAIRTGLNMSLVQLAKRLKKTSVSVKEIEQREEDKGITLNKLTEVAEALDCHFVYAFIPKDGSLQKLIDKRANQVAKEIVMRTSHTMKLEGQENTEERLKKAIKDRAEKIKNELPKYLWD
ncbi:MAG: mobile mystery protein A [Candidatus Lokiarchaeota archaeon]|nr:mobile mystery protein A [Candidatus Lokiarchaeota archaeon]